MSLRLSTVILPIYRWAEQGREVWARAEELGFAAAYTYDHLSWQASFRDGPWFGALPTLTAAAGATGRMRLGTMVTSPNFRHPVTLAKELITLDDISGGRLTLGIGAGGTGADASTLLGAGARTWTTRERTDRFAEFVPMLDRLLTQDIVTCEGDFYAAREARDIPGCVQRPRLPFAIAATGPRGMELAARHGQTWITTGDPKLRGTGATPDDSLRAVRDQVRRLEETCERIGRNPAELSRTMLTGFTPDRVLDSFDAFTDFAGRHAEAGIDEIVLHWPVADSMFAADQEIFERVAAESLSQIP